MQSSLQEALQELIDRLSESVRPDQTVAAFLAGGTATFMHLQQAGGHAAQHARFSEDADIHFQRAMLLDRNVTVAYLDANGEERLLALDGSYSMDIGLRHPDCFAEARLLYSSTNGRINLHLLSALDLAVTKAGRFQDHDRTDIELLARAGLLRADDFRQRATAALDYLATDPAMVRINIEEAAGLIQRSSTAN